MDIHTDRDDQKIAAFGSYKSRVNRRSPVGADKARRLRSAAQQSQSQALRGVRSMELPGLRALRARSQPSAATTKVCASVAAVVNQAAAITLSVPRRHQAGLRSVQPNNSQALAVLAAAKCCALIPILVANASHIAGKCSGLLR